MSALRSRRNRLATVAGSELRAGRVAEPGRLPWSVSVSALADDAGSSDTGRTTNDGPLADVMITLGARDLPTLRAFYARLGLPQLIDDEDFAAFDLRGVVLAVFPIEKLARDGNTQADLTGSGIRFTIGIMVNSDAEVDELTEQMRRAGAEVTKEPVDAEFFDGRSAYLCDPERNFIEIARADPTNPITARRRRP
jgi:predicted lactoylglutathione lyase